MSANVTASLTLKLNVAGAESLSALAKQVRGLSTAAQGTARGGLAQLGNAHTRVGAAAATAGAKQVQWADRLQLRLQNAARAIADTQIKEQARASAMTEKMNVRAAAMAEKLALRQKLATARAAARPGPRVHTVDTEMARLTMLADRRALTSQARDRLGRAAPSILTGHGFTSTARQSLGLMRDLTVAGYGVRMAYQTAAAGIGFVINPMREFSQELARIKVKGGFSDAQMKGIADAAKTQGRTSQFGAVDAAAAGVELAASGMGAEAIAAQMPTVLKFAQSGELGTGEASQVLVETMSQFFGPKQEKEFTRIGDVLKQVADSSTISVANLADSFKFVGPLAATAGMSLETTAGALGLLGERGIKAEMAGTSMRQLLLGMVDQSKPAAKALASIGMGGKRAREGIKDVPKFLREMDERLSALDKGDRLRVLAKVFDSRNVSAAEVLLQGARSGELSTYIGGAENAGGAMDKAAAIFDATPEGKIKRLEAATESARLELGDKLAPILVGKVIPGLTAAALATGAWIGNNSDLVGSLAIAIPSIGGMTLATNGLITAFTAVASASKALGLASWGVNAGTAFGTSFAGAALPVIAALIAGYGLGTILAKALDMEGIGAKIYEWMHPGETYNRADGQGISAGVDGTEHVSVREMIRRQKAGEGGSTGDPLLDNILKTNSESAPEYLRMGNPNEGSPGIPAAAPTGKLQIEITHEGKARVKDMTAFGLELGVSVAN